MGESDTPVWKMPVFMNYIAKKVKDEDVAVNKETFKIVFMDKNEKIISVLQTQISEESVLAFIMYTIKEG